MNIKDLIESAKQKMGSLGAVAVCMGIDQTRLSDWKAGRRKPDANEIATLAELAELPAFSTLGEVMRDLDPRFAPIWAKALGNLHAALAATPTIEIATSSTMTKEQTIRTLIAAVIDSLDQTPDQMQIKAGLMAVLNAFPEKQPTIATVPQIRGANARGVARFLLGPRD